MSEEQPQAAPTTTEETPAETPAATTDDQPAVTEVTEVTTEGEPEATPKEEPPKEEEPAKKEEPKEEVKEKPAPPPAKVVDYRTSKAGWVERQGLIFKKWQRQYMSLDEEDSVLRWWKVENRTKSDGALYMKYCADVSEPKAEATTTWPDDTADRCFVVSSPYRAFFLIAESADEKNDWIQKLTAAKEKYNTEGRKVITNELISLDGIKAALDSGAADLDKTVKEEGIVKEEEKKTEDAPPPAEGEPTAAEAGEGAAEVTVEVNVEPSTEEPPKETPAEEPPKEETPAEEPPKEDAPAEEPPKEETPAEEPPKEETPAASEGGEGETKAED